MTGPMMLHELTCTLSGAENTPAGLELCQQDSLTRVNNASVMVGIAIAATLVLILVITIAALWGYRVGYRHCSRDVARLKPAIIRRVTK